MKIAPAEAGQLYEIEFVDVETLPPHFNTFRLGDKWFQRLHQAGQPEVKLVGVDRENPEVRVDLGRAKVRLLATGWLETMLDQYSDDNHANLEHGLRGKTGQKHLIDVLEDVYGDVNTAGDTVYTVVALQKLPMVN